MKSWLTTGLLVIALLLQGFVPAMAQVMRAQVSDHTHPTQTQHIQLQQTQQASHCADAPPSQSIHQGHSAKFSLSWLFFSTCDHHCAAMVAMLPSVSLTPALAVPMQGDSLYVFSVSQTLPWRLERPPRA